jgi:hypothetical protein
VSCTDQGARAEGVAVDEGGMARRPRQGKHSAHILLRLQLQHIELISEKEVLQSGKKTLNLRPEGNVRWALEDVLRRLGSIFHPHTLKMESRSNSQMLLHMKKRAIGQLAAMESHIVFVYCTSFAALRHGKYF